MGKACASIFSCASVAAFSASAACHINVNWFSGEKPPCAGQPEWNPLCCAAISTQTFSMPVFYCCVYPCPVCSSKSRRRPRATEDDADGIASRETMLTWSAFSGPEAASAGADTGATSSVPSCFTSASAQPHRHSVKSRLSDARTSKVDHFKKQTNREPSNAQLATEWHQHDHKYTSRTHANLLHQSSHTSCSI